MMSKRIRNIIIGLAGLLLLAVLVYQIPYIKSVLSWRIEKFMIYTRNVFDPVGPVPTALPVTPHPITPTVVITATSTPMIDLTPSITPTATFAPLPAQASIASPPFEQQTPNNCGPATLSMALQNKFSQLLLQLIILI